MKLSSGRSSNSKKNATSSLKKSTMRSDSIDTSPRSKSNSSNFGGNGLNNPRISNGANSANISRGTITSQPSKANVGAVTIKGSGNPRKSSSTVRLESQTIGQIKQDRKRQIAAEERRVRAGQKTRKSGHPFVFLGIGIAFLIALLAGLFVVYKTDIFKIETIDITGTDHLTTQEVSALVSVPQGTTLFNLDADSIVASLERDSWVESVDVNRILPNKLEIVIHERSIVAVAEIPMGDSQEIQEWAIAKDGVWLMAIPEKDTELGSQISEQIYQDAQSALHITDVEYGVQPEIGAHCTDSAITNGLEIISGMTTSLAEQVKSVSAPDVESTMLVLDNNVEIAFGTSDDIRDKERIALQIMEDNPKVVYINVRVPDRPTWRSA